MHDLLLILMVVRIVLLWILVLAIWTQGSGWVTVDTDLLPWILAVAPSRSRRDTMLVTFVQTLKWLIILHIVIVNCCV